MTQRTISRYDRQVRRSPRPRTASISSGFLGMLVKLVAGGNALDQARRRVRR